jgi:hypothetical protein
MDELTVQHFNITMQLLMFDPADPDCENEEILRNTTSGKIGASGECWCKC